MNTGQNAAALLHDGRFDEAIALLRPHLARHPGDHPARANLALALLATGDAEGASREAAIAAVSGLPAANGLLAASLQRLGRHQAAFEAARAALAAAPALDEARFIAGTALLDLGRHDEAASYLAGLPRHPAAQLNLGVALTRLGEDRAAEAALHRAARLDPRNPIPLLNLAYLLTAQHRLDEAIATYRAALALAPADARLHHDHGFACLLAGDYATGWNELAWRTPEEAASLAALSLSCGEWDGSAPAGQRILVGCVQGLGDAIQMARFLPDLAARGATITLACDPALHRLLSRLDGISAVTDSRKPAPPHDRWVAQFSLPRLAGTRLDTIPRASVYLAADPVKVASWQARLPPGPRLGLAWAGNPRHQNDARRSLPREALAPLLGLPGITVVSLQQGHAAPDGAIDAAPSLADLDDAAAVIACLDLVIAADTAIAHLAGALGRPVWVLLPYAPDWRWGLASPHTPWYASATLFRQPRPGDWASVIHAIAAGLARP